MSVCYVLPPRPSKPPRRLQDRALRLLAPPALPSAQLSLMLAARRLAIALVRNRPPTRAPFLMATASLASDARAASTASTAPMQGGPVEQNIRAKVRVSSLPFSLSPTNRAPSAHATSQRTLTPFLLPHTLPEHPPPLSARQPRKSTCAPCFVAARNGDSSPNFSTRPSSRSRTTRGNTGTMRPCAPSTVGTARPVRNFSLRLSLSPSLPRRYPFPVLQHRRDRVRGFRCPRAGRASRSGC